MKNIFRRFLAAAMSVVIAGSGMVNAVSAATPTQEQTRNTLRAGGGLSMTCDETGLKFSSGLYAGESIWFMRASGDYVFCMNKGARMHTGASYKIDNSYWNAVNAQKRDLIGLAYAISYDPTYGGGPDIYPRYFYTRQLLLWEIMGDRWNVNTGTRTGSSMINEITGPSDLISQIKDSYNKVTAQLAYYYHASGFTSVDSNGGTTAVKNRMQPNKAKKQLEVTLVGSKAQINDMYVSDLQDQADAKGLPLTFTKTDDTHILVTTPETEDESVTQKISSAVFTVDRRSDSSISTYGKGALTLYSGTANGYQNLLGQVPASPKKLYFKIKADPTTPDGGNVTVKKVDASSNTPLSGATFGLYDADHKLITDTSITDQNNAISGSDGVASFPVKKDGTYYVHEISAPDNYSADSGFYPVVVKSGKAAQITVQDMPNTQLTLVVGHKYGEYDDEAALGGCSIKVNVTYQVIDKEALAKMLAEGQTVTDPPLKDVTDDFFTTSASDGSISITIQGIAPDTEPTINSVEELPNTTTTQGGYTWAGSRISNYVYSNDGGCSVSGTDLYNYQQKSVITVQKRDKGTGSILVAGGTWETATGNKPQGDATFAGAKYQIIRVDGHDADGRPIGEILQTLTTDSTGSASSSPLQQGVRYAIIETNAPKGMLLYDNADYAAYHGSWYQEFVCLFNGNHADLTSTQITLLNSSSATTGSLVSDGTVTNKDKVKDGYLHGYKFLEKDPNGNVDGDDNQGKTPVPGVAFDIYLASATPHKGANGQTPTAASEYSYGVSKKDGHQMTSAEIAANPSDVKGLVDTRTTDKTGEWTSRLLPYGYYIVVERDALTGYDIATAVFQWVDTQVNWNATIQDWTVVRGGTGLGNDNGLGIEHNPPLSASGVGGMTRMELYGDKVLRDVENNADYDADSYNDYITIDDYNLCKTQYAALANADYYFGPDGSMYDNTGTLNTAAVLSKTGARKATAAEAASFAATIISNKIIMMAGADIPVIANKDMTDQDLWIYWNEIDKTDPFTTHLSEFKAAHPSVDVKTVDNLTAPLYIENQVTARHVRIQKIDSVSGKIVPYTDFYFKVWDCTRKCWVTDNQTAGAALNPVTVWKTDEKGNVTGNDQGGAANLADLLEWGSAGYDVYEVHTGAGYYLTDKPVHFTLDGAVDPRDQTLVVNFADAPILGTATLTKTADGATGTTGSDGSKQFTYTNNPLPGAVYGVYAAEDITARDIDGTVRQNRNTTLSKTYSVDDKYGKHRTVSYTYADSLTKDALVETVMTDSSGKITTSNLYEGKYYFKELYSPVGYTLSDEEVPFTIVDTHNVAFDTSDTKLNPQNPRYKGINTANNSTDPSITKENLEYSGEKARLAAIKTLVKTSDALAPLEHVECKENDTRQQAHISLLKRFVELPISKNLDYTGTTIVIKAAQNIAAVKDKDGKIVLPAAKLGDTIQTITLKKGDNPQKILTKELAVGGKYTATMTVTPEPDKIDLRTTTPYTFVVELPKQDDKSKAGTGSGTSSGTSSGSKETEKPVVLAQTLDLTSNFLYKWNTANEQKHLKTTPDKALKDCVFGLYAAEDLISAKDGSVIVKKDTLLSKFSFDENGKATNILCDKDGKPTGKLSIDIPVGDFYVKELKTTDGYTLNSEKYDLLYYPCGVGTDVNGAPDQKHSQIIEITTTKTPLLNRPYDVQEPTPPAPTPTPYVPTTGDFTLTKTDQLTGDFLPGAEITLKDSAGNKHTAVTGSDGKLTIADLPAGAASWWESKAPDGYVLDSTVHSITIAVSQTYQATLADKPITGTFAFTKTDIADNTPLPDCVISIANVKTGKVVFTGKTDSDGKLVFKDLPVGDYTYQEVSAPPKYILNTKAYPFSIKENGQVVKAAMQDQIMTGTFELTKTDAVTLKILPGAEIAITDTSTGKVAFTGKTNTVGKLIAKLPVGEYSWAEVKAPENYALDKTAHAFAITEDGQTVKSTLKDNLLLGALEIVKTMDGKTDGQLAGIQFRVIGTAVNGQKYDKTFATDAHGKIEVKNLPVGTYTVHEIAGKVNTGYVLAADKTVSVKAGLVASIAIDNKKVKHTIVEKPPVVPKTGQNPVMPVIVSFVFACAVGAGAFTFWRRKKEKNTK